MQIETSKALSSLDFAIENLVSAGKEDDEFTVSEFSEKSGFKATASLNRLNSLVDLKFLKKRKILFDGRIVTVFKKADQM